MAVIVFVKFVEFVVGFIGHEFHELARIYSPQLLRSSQRELTSTKLHPSSFDRLSGRSHYVVSLRAPKET